MAVPNESTDAFDCPPVFEGDVFDAHTPRDWTTGPPGPDQVR